MTTAQNTDSNTPVSFYLMAAIAFPVSIAAAALMPPAAPATPVGIPLMFVLGAYFAICAPFFPTFVLYRLKVARAVDWYGEEATHFLYRGLGFAVMGTSTYMLGGQHLGREASSVATKGPPGASGIESTCSARAVPHQPPSGSLRHSRTTTNNSLGL